MAVIDVGLQLASDVLIQRASFSSPLLVLYKLTSSPLSSAIFLTYTIVTDDGSSAVLHLCYLTPTTSVFSITFVSPAVFGHTVLLLTLFASWQHWSTEKALAENVSSRTSLMSCLRKRHAEYVLAICLINFANVVLVVQTMVEPYKCARLSISLSNTDQPPPID
jgi:hypothetical protein